MKMGWIMAALVAVAFVAGCQKEIKEIRGNQDNQVLAVAEELR